LFHESKIVNELTQVLHPDGELFIVQALSGG